MFGSDLGWRFSYGPISVDQLSRACSVYTLKLTCQAAKDSPVSRPGGAVVLVHFKLRRRSRLSRTLVQPSSPSLRCKARWALSQMGNALLSSDLPFSVISNILLLRQPSTPMLTSPSFSNGPRFLLSVERSIDRSLARAVIEAEPSIPTAANTAN